MMSEQEAATNKWFRGMISRVKAEELLYGQPTGTFLVRISESRNGYSLSFVHQGRMRHYKIEATPDAGYIVVGGGLVLAFPGG